MSLYRSTAPHIVGREALFAYALEDFLNETTRQKPWLRARYEALLEDLNEHLDVELDRPAPVSVLNSQRANAWLRTLSGEHRMLAERALNDFTRYLVAWDWLEANPLHQLQAV